MSDGKRFQWTKENVEQLKKLWNAGVSARDIADELGNGVTRNSVIGKANRIGLSLPKNSRPGKNKKNGPVTYPNEEFCQWPFGHPDEPDFYFCCRPVEESRPYCLEHCNSAYRRLHVAAAS